MVEELPQGGGALGAARLLAVQAVQVQVHQYREAAQEVHPRRRHPYVLVHGAGWTAHERNAG